MNNSRFVTGSHELRQPNSKRLCLYCGELATRIHKGEHIVPEAIGGALTLKDVSDSAVCRRCNNGVLSHVDRELCSRSYLSVVASQELGAHLWQVWDVDHSAGNLLIEAKPAWEDGELSTLVAYPQMTLIGERTIADAICDRLLHHSYKIELKGESIRKNKK